MNSFSHYFIQFRLKSEIKTLNDLSDLLADKNCIIETSTLSRWQHGKRIPSNRQILILLLKIFIDRNGINNLEEANTLLESAKQGYLTKLEIEKLNFKKNSPQILPPRFNNFVGRKKLLKKIQKDLLKSKRLVISGLGGVGKSTLAIEYAYQFSSLYKDGILWAKVDTTNQMNILATFIHVYEKDAYKFKDIWSRSQILRNILKNKKVLIILDNVSQNNQIVDFIPITNNNHFIITSRKHCFSSIENAPVIDLDGFNEDEALMVFNNKLGNTYVEHNKAILLKLIKQVGNLPIAIDILAERFKYLNNIGFSSHFEISKCDLIKNLNGSDRNIKLVFQSSLESLDSKQKRVFLSLGVFGEHSFHYQAVAYITQVEERETLECLAQLNELSLIQRVDDQCRYKLHPLIYDFIVSQVDYSDFYIRLCNYFLQRYQFFKKRESVFDNSIFEADIENINHLIRQLFRIKNYKLVIEIWEYYVLTLWDLGLWDIIVDLSSILIDISRITDNPLVEARVLIRDLGILYFQRNQSEKAKVVIKNGLNLAEKINDKFLIAYAKLRFGMIFLQENHLKKSMFYLQEAFKEFTKLNEKGRLGEVLCYLSSIYLKQGFNEKSIICSKQAFVECSLINHKRCLSDSLSYQAEAYLIQKNFQKAQELFQKSMKIDQEIRRVGQIWIYNNLALKLIKLNQTKTNYNHFFKEFKKWQNKINLSWRLNSLKLFSEEIFS